MLYIWFITIVVILALLYTQYQNQKTQRTLHSTQQKLYSAEHSLQNANAQINTLTMQKEWVNQQLKEQKEQAKDMPHQLMLQFKQLATELLTDKQSDLQQTNQKNLDQILIPLKEKIQSFEKQVVRSNENAIARHATLRTELNKMGELQHRLSLEASNLTKALKGDRQVQGKWGEIILEKLLEQSGLHKNQEYFIQPSYTDKEGKRYRPDLLIKLPNNKTIIIDAKVSLLDYADYMNANNEQVKRHHLKKHIQSIRKHIKTLYSKEYTRQVAGENLDFVLMFMPIEPAFTLAMQKDHRLLEEAYQHHIALTSPSTLLPTLRMIAQLWRNEQQQKNAQLIAKQTGELYDKLVNFVHDLQKVGQRLEQGDQAYQAALNKLSTGRGNILNRAKKIIELGATPRKKMPEELLIQSTTIDRQNDA